MAEEDKEDLIPLVRAETGEQGVVVHVSGEIDITAAPQLDEALQAALTDGGGADEVVIDLSGLTFCDSSGLNALLQARLTAEEHDRRLRLHAPTAQVVRLLEMTGTDQLFAITGR